MVCSTPRSNDSHRHQHRPASWVTLLRSKSGKSPSDEAAWSEKCSSPTSTIRTNAEVGPNDGTPMTQEYTDLERTWSPDLSHLDISFESDLLGHLEKEKDHTSPEGKSIRRSFKGRLKHRPSLDNIREVSHSSPFSVSQTRAGAIHMCRVKVNEVKEHGRNTYNRLANSHQPYRGSQDSAQPPLLTKENTAAEPVKKPVAAIAVSSVLRPQRQVLNTSPSNTYRESLCQSKMGRLKKSVSVLFGLDKGHHVTKLDSKIITEELEPDSMAERLTFKEIINQSRRDYTTSLNAQSPKPLLFDNTANRYVDGDRMKTYPLGVNPLAMHGNTEVFACAPPGVSISKPGTASTEESMIDDAAIYSPSTGDLSQYNRTPPPTLDCVNEEEEQTPVREPARKKRFGLRKSLSVLGLFRRNQGAPKENQKPRRNVKHIALGEAPTLPEIPHLSPSVSGNVSDMLSDASHVKSGSKLEGTSTSTTRLRNTPTNGMSPEQRLKRRGIVGWPSPG